MGRVQFTGFQTAVGVVAFLVVLFLPHSDIIYAGFAMLLALGAAKASEEIARWLWSKRSSNGNASSNGQEPHVEHDHGTRLGS